MTDGSMQKLELTGHGFRVSVVIMDNNVRVVIDDRTMLGDKGITVISMYHNDNYVRIGTDNIIKDIKAHDISGMIE